MVSIDARMRFIGSPGLTFAEEWKAVETEMLVASESSVAWDEDRVSKLKSDSCFTSEK